MDDPLSLTLTLFPFAVNVLLLLPGLNQHGIITKYAGMAKRELNKLLKQKEKKNEWGGVAELVKEQWRNPPNPQSNDTKTTGDALDEIRQSNRKLQYDRHGIKRWLFLGA